MLASAIARAGSLRSYARYLQVAVSIEFWLWPWKFGANNSTDAYYVRFLALHLGPLTLRLRWSFFEDG